MGSLSVRAAVAVLSLSMPALVAAQPDEAGRAKAKQVCAVCHGELGIASAPDAPNIAGHPEPYLVAQLRAFRSGARKHEVMNVIAKSLSDDDIAAVARWYHSIQVEAKPPR